MSETLASEYLNVPVETPPERLAISDDKIRFFGMQYVIPVVMIGPAR